VASATPQSLREAQPEEIKHAKDDIT
jgi:hypothetical protein